MNLLHLAYKFHESDMPKIMKIFSDLWIEDLTEFSSQIEEIMRLMSKIFVSIRITEEIKDSSFTEDSLKIIVQLKENSSKIEKILDSVETQSDKIMQEIDSLHKQNEKVSEFWDKRKLECLHLEVNCLIENNKFDEIIK